MAITFDMAFFGLQISDNQHETPEGFLVCMNVPVARTGMQIYAENEVINGGSPNKTVKVYRLPEDVFSADTLRSFEGKSVTNLHPDMGLVDTTNARFLDCGHGQHARREGDFIILDLVIKDETLINDVKNDVKREVSAGYRCEYEDYKDGFRQFNIQANHIAIVPKGRAGPKVSVKDHDVVINKRKTRMSKEELMAKMFASYAKDADPADVVEAAKLFSQPAKHTVATDEDSFMAKIAKMITRDKKAVDEDGDNDETEKLRARIAELEKQLESKGADKKAKDKKAEDEDVETEAVAEIIEELLEESTDAKDGDDDDQMSEEEKEKKKKAEAKDAARQIVKDFAPAIAKLGPNGQKIMKDALAKHIDRSPGSYAKIMNAVESNKKQAVDAAKKAEDASLIGKQAREKWFAAQKQK